LGAAATRPIIVIFVPSLYTSRTLERTLERAHVEPKYGRYYLPMSSRTEAGDFELRFFQTLSRHYCPLLRCLIKTYDHLFSTLSPILHRLFSLTIFSLLYHFSQNGNVVVHRDILCLFKGQCTRTQLLLNVRSVFPIQRFDIRGRISQVIPPCWRSNIMLSCEPDTSKFSQVAVTCARHTFTL
jgi:hypothetical protein